MEMNRQGDLLFVRVLEIPDEAKEDKSGIIARGEVTGHTHRIRNGSGAVLLVAATVYIRALQETQIDHEEHKTINLPPGNWEVKRQQEYTPAGWSRIAD